MNSVSTMASNVASGSIAEAGLILNSPMGYIIIFVIAMAILGTAVYYVKHWNKG